MYLAMTSDSNLLSKQDPEDRWGYGALQEKVKFSGSIPETGESELFKQFLGLKEREGLYGVFPGALKAVSTMDHEVNVQGQLHLPGNIKPGDYRVDLSVLNKGKVIERRSIEFSVVMRQVAAFLSFLAQQYPTLYGILAVTIAMAMGLLMGFVFRGRGAH